MRGVTSTTFSQQIISGERCYIHNIFTTNHKRLVVTGSNLNLTLKSLFCLNNNN